MDDLHVRIGASLKEANSFNRLNVAVTARWEKWLDGELDKKAYDETIYKKFVNAMERAQNAEAAYNNVATTGAARIAAQKAFQDAMEDDPNTRAADDLLEATRDADTKLNAAEKAVLTADAKAVKAAEKAGCEDLVRNILGRQ